jgi:hypothetical protein
MPQQLINVGPAPNSPDSDNIRDSFVKTNSNFTEVYGVAGTVTRMFSPATDDARLALANLRTGDVAHQTNDNTLWLWTGATWARKTGRILKPADAAALAGVSGMIRLDLAQTQDDDAWYVYDGSAWESLATPGGGGGGGDGAFIETAATFTKVSTEEVAGRTTADVRNAASNGPQRVLDLAHNAGYAAGVVGPALQSGLEYSETLLGVTNLRAAGIVSRDTNGAQPILNYAYAGDARGGGGVQYQAALGMLDQNNDHLAEYTASRTAGAARLGSRVVRGAGETFIEVRTPASYTLSHDSGGVTSQLSTTPALLSWNKEVTLSAFPNSRSDGASTKALYVGAAGQLRYGAITATSLVDGSGDSEASFPSDNLWSVTLGSGQVSEFNSTGLRITGGDFVAVSNSRGLELRTATGVRALLNLIDDAGATDGIRLQLTPL